MGKLLVAVMAVTRANGMHVNSACLLKGKSVVLSSDKSHWATGALNVVRSVPVPVEFALDSV